jgi:hypothetical protein
MVETSVFFNLHTFATATSMREDVYMIYGIWYMVDLSTAANLSDPFYDFLDGFSRLRMVVEKFKIISRIALK